MKRQIITFMTVMSVMGALAQNVNGDERQYIDWSEDSTEIVTVADIIKEQQEVTSRNSTVKHFEDVWSRRSYINLSYNNTRLEPDEQIPTGMGGIVPSFKSDWGASIQLGRSYRLHKKPIANTLQFNIDYTYIDLCVNHFKAENGSFLYDSSNKIQQTNNNGRTDEYYHIPWNLEKYEANYSMALGPSLTIAPFNHTRARGLHYLKLNAYYHIGYGVSFMFMKNNEDVDQNQSSDSDHANMKDNLKLMWGHGLTNSFGISLSWKVIGVGYEHRSSTMKYKSMNTKDFEDATYKFNSSTNRVFIQFRM